MSDTANTRTLHAVPEPEPLTGLTGAPAAVYTELAGLTEPATAAELALAAGLGRSTTSKALTTLEQHGLALREPGGHEGARRTPDRWHPIQTTPTPDTDTETPVDAEPTSDGPDTTQPPAQDTADTTPEADPETTAPSATTSAPDTGTSPAPSTNDAPETTAQSESVEDELATAPAPHDPAPAPAPAPGQRVRLAPGGLRQMVIDHLTAHPDEAFTATRISRVIEKSSGAIANCLATLVKQHIAEQVSDTPRTFRLTTPTADTK
ncbi:helix-turn-helix domain-containing protein [Streptomyces sp. NPDC006692]|uniref:helix-turn-helix domain-containing protein n=1 Tax=Streptomyces sp. NPDC006692 TaxID=3364758 RepID=UPI0036D0D021